MTTDDLRRIEAELGVRLPAEYAALMRDRGAELTTLTLYDRGKVVSHLESSLYQTADGVIDANRGYWEMWQDQYGEPGGRDVWLFIGDNGGGDFLCLRLDGTPGVFLCGEDGFDTDREPFEPDLAAYVAGLLAEYLLRRRLHPFPGRSAFAPACPPADRAAVTLEASVYTSYGLVGYLADDTPVTADKLAAGGVDEAAVRAAAVAAQAALMGVPPGRTAATVRYRDDMPWVNLELSGVGDAARDTPYWQAGLDVWGGRAAVWFHGFRSGGLNVEAPADVPGFDWGRLRAAAADLVAAVTPGGCRAAVGEPAPAARVRHSLRYVLPVDVRPA